METVLVIIIVSVVLAWACRATYRVFTGKGGGCDCAGSCSKRNDCSELSHNNDKDLNSKN